MQPLFTLLTNAARTQTGQVVKGPFVIDGVLNSDGLTVSLKSLDPGEFLSKQTFPRFDDQELRITDGIPHGSRFCDLLAGETNEGLGLVIESHRFYEADPQGNARSRKRFYRQALICSGLSHVNIVPFLGVLSNKKFPCACVFESAGKEDLLKYLVNNPKASKLKSLREVARGLHHIHDLDIIHGSIRGANIRVDDKGTARIAGFASAVFLPESNATLNDGDAPSEFTESRWCSPEILHPGFTGEKATKAIDIYAFGMLAYEVFSGRVPFYDRRTAAAVFAVITTNERPPRPAHQELSDELWEMIEKCWQKDPSQRPAIQEIVVFLEK